jgi:cell division protein FtsW
MDRKKLNAAWYNNLYILPIILSLIGLYFVYEASSIRAIETYKDDMFFLKRQILWCGLGITSMILVSRISYRRLSSLALPAIIFSLITLVAVLIPGIGSKINGASRWIDLGPFGFQPAEFVKLSVILCGWSNLARCKTVDTIIMDDMCQIMISATCMNKVICTFSILSSISSDYDNFSIMICDFKSDSCWHGTTMQSMYGVCIEEVIHIA